MSVPTSMTRSTHLLRRAERRRDVGPAGRRARGRRREGGVARVAGRVVELEAERLREGLVVGGADVVGRHAAAGEERAEVDRRAVDRGLDAAGPLDLRDLEAGALRALGDGLRLERRGAERGGAVRERAAVDVVGVVRRAVHARPGAGRERVPAGAGVGRGLGQQAATGRRGALLEEVRHRGHQALRGVALDQVLAHAVGGEEDGAVAVRGRVAGRRRGRRGSSPGGRRPPATAGAGEGARTSRRNTSTDGHGSTGADDAISTARRSRVGDPRAGGQPPLQGTVGRVWSGHVNGVPRRRERPRASTLRCSRQRRLSGACEHHPAPTSAARDNARARRGRSGHVGSAGARDPADASVRRRAAREARPGPARRRHRAARPRAVRRPRRVRQDHDPRRPRGLAGGRRGGSRVRVRRGVQQAGRGGADRAPGRRARAAGRRGRVRQGPDVPRPRPGDPPRRGGLRRPADRPGRAPAGAVPGGHGGRPGPAGPRVLAPQAGPPGRGGRRGARSVAGTGRPGVRRLRARGAGVGRGRLRRPRGPRPGPAGRRPAVAGPVAGADGAAARGRGAGPRSDPAGAGPAARRARERHLPGGRRRPVDLWVETRGRASRPRPRVDAAGPPAGGPRDQLPVSAAGRPARGTARRAQPRAVREADPRRAAGRRPDRPRAGRRRRRRPRPAGDGSLARRRVDAGRARADQPRAARRGGGGGGPRDPVPRPGPGAADRGPPARRAARRDRRRRTPPPGAGRAAGCRPRRGCGARTRPNGTSPRARTS